MAEGRDGGVGPMDATFKAETGVSGATLGDARVAETPASLVQRFVLNQSCGGLNFCLSGTQTERLFFEIRLFLWSFGVFFEEHAQTTAAVTT